MAKKQKKLKFPTLKVILSSAVTLALAVAAPLLSSIRAQDATSRELARLTQQGSIVMNEAARRAWDLASAGALIGAIVMACVTGSIVSHYLWQKYNKEK